MARLDVSVISLSLALERRVLERFRPLIGIRDKYLKRAGTWPDPETTARITFRSHLFGAQ